MFAAAPLRHKTFPARGDSRHLFWSCRRRSVKGSEEEKEVQRLPLQFHNLLNSKIVSIMRHE
jgi:hypothetical protein